LSTRGVAEAGPPPLGRRDLAVAFALLGLAAALRLASFHRSVIDWDESLYFLMAEAWRAGHLPYTEIWDNKPIGIYVIFASCQILFGDNIASMRIAAVLAVSATAFCLYRLALAIGDHKARRQHALALVAGLLYLFCSVQDGGMAANTEIFIAPFVCGGVWIALSGTPGRLAAFLSGLLFGIAFIVKYVALFECPAPLAALLWRKTAHGRATLAAYFLTGMAVPMGCCVLLYSIAGHLDSFVSASLVPNIRRLDLPFSGALAIQAFHDHAADLILMYGAALAAPLLLWRALLRHDDILHPADARVPLVLTLWIAGAFAGTVSAKSFYAHYFLQPLPPLCLTSIWIAGSRLRLRGAGAVLAGLVLLLQPVKGAWQAIAATWQPVRLDQPGIGWSRDEPARIAADLRPALVGVSGVPLYVFDFEPILYSLTATPSPTPYAFPSFIISHFLSRVAAIDPEATFAGIVARQPHFIVCARFRRPVAPRDNIEVYAALRQELGAHYRVWKNYPSAIVYRLRSDP
jgi:4-amino-4-deoxy-L-arabinose transferase-like glycosyltransferase